jgi:RNA polymerase sigma-70 factor (ECF subfamily)
MEKQMSTAAIAALPWFHPRLKSSTIRTEAAPVEPPADDVTQLLHRAGSGDRSALDMLFRLVYPKLHELAARKMAREKPGHTLSPTALVAEVYLKLAGQLGLPWKNRSQFFAVSALAMRRVLVDSANRKLAAANGGGWRRVALDPVIPMPERDADEVLAIHECLERLERNSPRQAKVVELRFFGGLSSTEVAEYLGVSLSTVELEWRFARAWMRVELEGKRANSSRGMGAGAETV